jgi:predicted transcriptional regulator
MSEGKVALNLRLPEELHRTLKRVAEREDRTLSNLIVHVLRERVANEPRAEIPSEKSGEPERPASRVKRRSD